MPSARQSPSELNLNIYTLTTEAVELKFLHDFRGFAAVFGADQRQVFHGSRKRRGQLYK